MRTPFPARPIAVDVEFLKAARDRLDKNDEDCGIAQIGKALRVLKIAEELGEVVSLIILRTGQNPRKGDEDIPTNEAVRDELFDVALTALVAAFSFQPFRDEQIFGSVATEHIARKLRRLFES